MNRSKVKEFPSYIFRVQVGSRSYGFHLDNSDRDFLAIYCILKDDAFDSPEYCFREFEKDHDITYLELSRLQKMIQLGYPEIGDILYSQPIYRTNIFENLISIRLSLISKKTLNQWLEFSNTFFANSKRLGKLGLKTAIDFCHVIGRPHIKGPKAWPLADCIERGSFELDSTYVTHSNLTYRLLALEPTPGIDNVYTMYKHYNDLGNPIIDIHGNIQTFEDASHGSYVGVIIYDKKAHDEYKIARKAKTVRGYAPKSLVHAFRVLERAEMFCKESIVKINVQNPGFYRDILQGNHGGEYLFDKYERKYEEVSDLILKSTFIENINNILLTRTIEEVRNNVEKILVKLSVN